MKVISLFSGAGGLDLGFKKVGFKTVWANEFDKTIWDTFSHNFSENILDTRNMKDISSSEIPDADGIIGGPPCQSWSEAGKRLGIEDNRGQLFYEYIRVLKDKKPKFFLAENVSGILQLKHSKAFSNIIKEFEKVGYDVSYQLLNANNYGVPQDRPRVFIIGYLKSLNTSFSFPKPQMHKPTLRDAISDLIDAKPAKEKNKANLESELSLSNHEYMHGGFSTIYMSRNRVRSWNEPSYTIQAGGRHAPIHPQAPKMLFIKQNKRIFVPEAVEKYRRLTVRECARIQTFPDNFLFKYENISDGYKMVGNAVPVVLAEKLAKQIYQDLQNHTLNEENSST